MIAAEGQLPGTAVEFAIAPFHRVDAPAIAHGPVANLNRLKQGRKIILKSQIQTQPRILGFQIRD